MLLCSKKSSQFIRGKRASVRETGAGCLHFPWRSLSAVAALTENQEPGDEQLAIEVGFRN
jgi:hypothetical protein